VGAVAKPLTRAYSPNTSLLGNVNAKPYQRVKICWGRSIVTRLPPRSKSTPDRTTAPSSIASAIILLWGISGIYFSFPQLFTALFILDPDDKFTDQMLLWLSRLHFGRFDWFTEALWSLLRLVPAVLAVTGVFLCCRRVIYKKHTNPNIPSHQT
jgi:hypothetical protein